jgi:hypothetical protein
LTDKRQSTQQTDLKIVGSQQKGKPTQENTPTNCTGNADVDIRNRSFPDRQKQTSLHFGG